ncbi:MAG: COX15/CtaA family protein [Bdellovibrionaceae bacterium]|nr:COX15/CtaA family protein [Pseudobdellovibrionaceae bacterium]
MSKSKKLLWLLSLLIMLFSMVAVGGITRLTKSGLSITEWRPVTGTLPPLSEEAWQKEFDLYRSSPEFEHHNNHFELEDYKGIFWWEYLHRLLGRVIFFTATVMGFVFWRKKEFSGKRALLLPALIAFQGLIGWLMVKTGLNHRPSVSHYMLAVHFLLALLTMSVVYHSLAKMKQPLVVKLSTKGRFLIGLLGGLILLQILYGCFTGGLRAGLYFNTFPLMDGRVLPPQGWDLVPGFRNLFENPITVQWIHRWLGIGLAVILPLVSFHLLRCESPAFKRPILHLVSVVVIQVLLGISTLLFLVPVPLAVFHQAMAALIWLGYCNLIFRIKTP